jgi:hypothetical protein
MMGDTVSRAGMMAHPVLTLVALSGLAVSALIAAAGLPAGGAAAVSLAILGALAIERGVSGARAAILFRDPTPLIFPFAHFLRDIAWVAAMLVWSTRRLLLQPALPQHSMRPGARHDGRALSKMQSRVDDENPRLLCLIPVHNESASLPAVVEELRNRCPDLDIVVIDDGSTDETSAVTEELEVLTIRLRERLGIGSAMRAGLRYAMRTGYTAVVRIDGDGQHRAEDARAAIRLVCDGHTDAALGTRFADADHVTGPKSLFRKLLAQLLSIQTGRHVTDPTCGLYALGSRAIRLLADHHPTGYPEPELLLLLNRAGLRAVEHPIAHRPRSGGRTSLTLPRVAGAVARVALAMLIVPLRRPVGDVPGE